LILLFPYYKHSVFYDKQKIKNLWVVSNIQLYLDLYKYPLRGIEQLAAPLIAGNDVRNMSDEIREILTNTEVIAVDQDSLGIQGRKVRDDGDFEVWSKPLRDGSRAVVLLDLSSDDTEI